MLFSLQDDLSSDSDEDVASELKADYIEDGTESPHTNFRSVFIMEIKLNVRR